MRFRCYRVAGGPPGGTVDAADLKSAAEMAWGFDSPGGHHVGFSEEHGNPRWVNQARSGVYDLPADPPVAISYGHPGRDHAVSLVRPAVQRPETRARRG